MLFKQNIIIFQGMQFSALNPLLPFKRVNGPVRPTKPSV